MKIVGFSVIFFFILMASSSYLPVSLRLIPGRVFPSPNGDPNQFYARYDFGKNRRIVVALSISIFLGFLRWIDVGEYIFGGAMVLTVAGFVSLLIWDMLKARG